MSDGSSLRLKHQAPIKRSDVNAHGFDPQLSQLVVEAMDGEQHLDLLASLLAKLAGDAGMFLLVIGPFADTDATSEVVGAEPVGTVEGMHLYHLQSNVPITANLFEIQAEELAFIACERDCIGDYLDRIKRYGSKPFRMRETTLRGALTKALDLVDPVAYYASSHRSLEFVGTRDVINRIADQTRALIT